jgi:DNA-binding transcriptional LysR family regulator
MDRFACISVFVAAVEEGSLVAAGRKFGLSASMAGKYLGWLEADLGTRLIQRSTRSLSITDAGRTYYARCKRILEEFQDANQEASESAATLRGLLRIAAPVSFGALHMGEVVARFLVDHPQVTAEVILDDHYADLHTAGIDVAIRIGRLADSELVARRLAPCRMIFCAAPSYLQRYGRPHTPSDLRDAPRLAFSGAVTAGDWHVSDAAGRVHPISGPLRALANNMQLLLSMAVAGLGLAYGPTFAFGPAIADGRLVQLLPDCVAEDLTVQAIYPSARYLPSKVRSFVDYVAKAFAGEPQWDDFQHRRPPG